MQRVGAKTRYPSLSLTRASLSQQRVQRNERLLVLQPFSALTQTQSTQNRQYRKHTHNFIHRNSKAKIEREIIHGFGYRTRMWP